MQENTADLPKEDTDDNDPKSSGAGDTAHDAHQQEDQSKSDDTGKKKRTSSCYLYEEERREITQ
jgi:hypothetical protein